MKTKLTLLGLCLASGLSLIAQSILPTDAKIQYTGRIDFSTPTQPTYSYPGVSIKAMFNGKGISAVIFDYGSGGDSYTNYYKVFIDGMIVTEQLAMSQGLKTYTLATGLTAGDHSVEIMKITEGYAGKSSFKGFTVEGGSQVLLDLPARSTKKIEFIGDSWTAGYGNLSQYKTGNESMVNSGFVAKNEDNYLAWGPLAAKSIGAEYHVTAISGRGLYRNNSGALTGTLPLNYDYTHQDNTSVTYDHSIWHPDVISIHLGTNDMAQEESGAAYKLDDAVFEQTYKDFVAHLLHLHPCAKIIICFGNSKSDSWPTWTKQLTRLRTVANNVQAVYPNGNVTTLELPFTAEKWTGNPLDDCGYGDAWHPSLCSHQKMSVKLAEKINSMTIDWGNQSCSSSSAQEIKVSNVVVYPNPVEDVLSVSGLNNQQWTIVNQMGSIVLFGNETQIDIQSLSSGMYYLVSNNYSVKFIKN